MKVSLSWLKEYVDITLPPHKLAQRLTLAGNEVKGMQVVGGSWEFVSVGEITAINPHPNADRLRLVTVNLGTEETTVVCGAPNLRCDDKIAFASVGAQLYDGHSGKLSRLEPAKIRGVASRGMVCSEKELGISESHQGIMVLPEDAPLGMPLADYLGDVIFDLDITPNRADCLSVVGIAREVSALTGQGLHLPRADYAESAVPIDQQVSVSVIDPELCSRYSASLITGVKIGPSPAWLQQRLLAYGMRPINNVVDVTNYVMVEYGQPLHAFDYQRIRGGKIIVRRAEAGETLDTLDGTKRSLDDNMLVIADEKGAVAVAGIMGGAASEVSEGTTSILLEAANFNAASIHHTGSALRLPSEARMRFERGIRPELTVVALKRATQLISKLGGGEAAQGLIDVYPGRADHEPIRLSPGKLERVLGVGFSPEQITGALTALGFTCRTDADGDLWAAAPYWRGDIRHDGDLIEEVARIVGYDKIPMTLLSRPIPHQSPEPVFSLKRKLRGILVGYGFSEIVTYSLTSLELLRRLPMEPGSPDAEPLRMANPMTFEQEYLRPNLRANLLTTLAANRRHEDGGIRLFELGKVYLTRPKDLPEEPEVLCGLMSGPRLEHSWHGGDELFGFYDAKGVVEALLAHLGIAADFVESNDPALHNAKQAGIMVSGNKLGVIGELHPKVLTAFEITGPVCLFEINLAQLLNFTVGHRVFQPVARFPVVERDIALVLDEQVSHARVQEIITGFPLVAQVTIFDAYWGKQVPAGKKSLAYRIVFRSLEHTLTDTEVDKVQQKILTKLSRELGATLRS
ncbi:MAG: phenylalanine--tRNA ligase subunit beta [Dehalococcoidales bacterium]|nr:phenylalanine--tRNA ligase subunit beta [Dehalococcoidales bacterium]